MKEKIIYFLKLFLSLFLLVYLFFNINLEELKTAVSSIKIIVILIAISIIVFSIYLNAVKWHVLLSDIDILFLSFLTYRAQFYSTVFPGQLFGEASKLTVWKNKCYTVSHVTASVIFDKITGVIGQIILIIIGLYFSNSGKGITNKWTYIILGVLFFATIILLSEKHIVIFVEKIFNWFEKKTKKSLKHFRDFYSSWVMFSTKKITLFKSIIWGIINQTMGIVMVWYISISMGLGITIWDYFWVIPILSFILLLPISFAGIGLRDISLVSLLSIFNVASEKAIIISMILLLGQIVVAAIGGIMNSIYNLKA